MSIQTPTQPRPDTCVPRDPAVNQRLLAGKQEFLGYLCRRLGSHDEAEDVLQNFSLKVIRSSQSAGSEEKINAWMGQILGWALVVVGIGVVLGGTGPIVGVGMWTAFVGWFVASAAAQGYERVIAQRSA